jgi:hypothetical protein
MADDHTKQRNEAAKKQLASDKEARQRSTEEYQKRMKGRPTPTQEECDLIKLGAAPDALEPDGSDPDPNNGLIFGQHSRQLEPAHSGGGYQTRQSTARSSESKS